VYLLRTATEQVYDIHYEDLCILERTSLKAFVCDSQANILLHAWYLIVVHEQLRYERSCNAENNQ
jgi:hypothetical protein